MISHPRNTPFDHISQRAAYAYLISLVPETPGSGGQGNALSGFLLDLYTAIYHNPEAFGLPVGEDLSITGEEADPVQFKQVVKRKLDVPKRAIENGLELLMQAGQSGQLAGEALVLPAGDWDKLVKSCKVKPKFLTGLAGIGLAIQQAGGEVRLSTPEQPGWAAELAALAQACSRYADERLGRFMFGRADFRALSGDFCPPATDLYAIFDPPDRERLDQLDEFFTDLGYRPIVKIPGVMGWEVQYQGPSKIKSTPLLRVHYDPRYRVPLRVDVKCVATSRIVDLVPQQPYELQVDFAGRVYDCRGQECNWCEGRKGLGPVAFEFEGVLRTICWYHNPEVNTQLESWLELVQDYALMHQALA